MLSYTGPRENPTKFLEGDEALGSLKNMRGCILELNPEGLGW